MSWQFKGCYKDVGSDRSLGNWYKPHTQRSHEECRAAADAAGAKYYGLQHYQGDGNKETGACYYGNTFKDHGPATNCVKAADGSTVGGSWSNALYEKIAAPSPTPVSVSDDSSSSFMFMGIVGFVGLVLLIMVVLVIMKLRN